MVLLRETYLFVGIAVVGGSLIFWLGPLVVERFVQPSFAISDGLILAAIVSGAARIFAAVSRALASAFCSTAELHRFSAVAWVATGFAAAAGFGLAGYGLIGLICGVASGWMVRGVVAFLIARPYIVSGEPRPVAASDGRPGA